MHQLLEWLALPQFGLSTVFVVAFISATLLPLGSEPAVFGLIKINPELFWPAKLPFWPCLAYMAVGKFFRYLVMTSVLLYFMPGHLAM